MQPVLAGQVPEDGIRLTNLVSVDLQSRNLVELVIVLLFLKGFPLLWDSGSIEYVFVPFHLQMRHQEANGLCSASDCEVVENWLRFHY